MKYGHHPCRRGSVAACVAAALQNIARAFHHGGNVAFQQLFPPGVSEFGVGNSTYAVSRNNPGDSCRNNGRDSPRHLLAAIQKRLRGSESLKVAVVHIQPKVLEGRGDKLCQDRQSDLTEVARALAVHFAIVVVHHLGRDDIGQQKGGSNDAKISHHPQCVGRTWEGSGGGCSRKHSCVGTILEHACAAIDHGGAQKGSRSEHTSVGICVAMLLVCIVGNRSILAVGGMFFESLEGIRRRVSCAVDRPHQQKGGRFQVFDRISRHGFYRISSGGKNRLGACG